MVEKINEILKNVLPESANFYARERKGSFGGDYIMIWISAKKYNIHNVQGQEPQSVSLMLHLNDLDLHTQCYGGCGGGSIYRKPNMNDPKEKYLSMKSVKIPFRKPQSNEAAILRAIEKFAKNWIQTLKDNRDVLMYQDIVNYDELLKDC